MAKAKPNPLTVQAKDCYDPADYVLVHKDYLRRLQEEAAYRAPAPPYKVSADGVLTPVDGGTERG